MVWLTLGPKSLQDIDCKIYLPGNSRYPPMREAISIRCYHTPGEIPLNTGPSPGRWFAPISESSCFQTHPPLTGVQHCHGPAPPGVRSKSITLHINLHHAFSTSWCFSWFSKLSKSYRQLFLDTWVQWSRGRNFWGGFFCSAPQVTLEPSLIRVAESNIQPTSTVIQNLA